MQRCTVRVPLPGNPSKYGETYCYRDLDDKGACSVHGPQWHVPDREHTPKEKQQ